MKNKLTEENKSFLLSWKFWTFIGFIIVMIIILVNTEPQYIEQRQSDKEIKLIESKKYFYDSCMKGINKTGSEEYIKMEKSCRKGMDAIENPNYKEILMK